MTFKEHDRKIPAVRQKVCAGGGGIVND